MFVTASAGWKPAVRGGAHLNHEFATLLAQLIANVRETRYGRTPVIGVSGAQGSGKSYLCRAFAAANLGVAHFSIDDFYMPRARRRELARTLHPLFITRGPPGTHDLGYALGMMATMRGATELCETRLPRFDKASDERIEAAIGFRGKPEAFLIDGWCLGALAPDLGPPLNAIEASDRDEAWRKAQNAFLFDAYAHFFAQFDAIVYLKAPSWEVVKSWRAEQEAETLRRALTPKDSARLDRFMQHYERITRAMMAGGHCAHWLVELDEARAVINIAPNPPKSAS